MWLVGGLDSEAGIGESLGDRRQRHGRLHPCQRCAKAEVWAQAEREVADRGPGRIELVGTLVGRRVPVSAAGSSIMMSPLGTSMPLIVMFSVPATRPTSCTGGS